MNPTIDCVFPSLSLYNCSCLDLLAWRDFPKVDLFLTSPPYNIGSKSPKKITNRAKGGYDAKSFRGITDYQDSIPEDVYQAQQIHFINTCLKHLTTSGVIAYNHKNRYKNHSVISPYQWILKSNATVVTEITWDRGSTHENGLTHPRMIEEKIFILSNGGKCFYAPSDKSIPNPSTIWRINRQNETSHNAAFPMELAERLITLFCPEYGVVCDPYSGSGTTMIATARLNKGRGFIGSELLEQNCIMAKQRLDALASDFQEKEKLKKPDRVFMSHF